MGKKRASRLKNKSSQQQNPAGASNGKLKWKNQGDGTVVQQ